MHNPSIKQLKKKLFILIENLITSNRLIEGIKFFLDIFFSLEKSIFNNIPGRLSALNLYQI